ncbi:shikimate kinase [Iodidimonas sp. SYSU 1G8]|jgi:shikimate kinase|uniref:shikimate kinase n=1 Tax=Iodidimonas sp. SYSU 1G8 TaxID=3133967 RepID=UPI0031FEB998
MDMLDDDGATTTQPPFELDRSIVLVGLMGAGKTTIGRRLAKRLGVPFVDADAEIEKAAGCSIKDIFECYGEAAFREGERRVICRLMAGPPQIVATGGGAFMNDETRKRVKEAGVSVWLKADIPTLVARVGKRDTRPLLSKGDPETILRELAAKRDPFYAEADIHVESRDGPHDNVVDAVIDALRNRQAA